MFWGLILKSNKKYTQTIKKSFHLSHAALDVTSSSSGPVQVILTSDKNDYILCTLRKDSVEQVALELNIEQGEEISFTSKGQGNVHLTGNFIDDFDQLDEEEEDDEQEELVMDKKQKKGKKSEKTLSAEDDSEDDEDDDIDMAKELSGEESDEDDEEEDDSDDESEEEEVQEPVAKQRKVEKPKLNGTEKQLPNKKVKKEQNSTEQPKGEKTLQGGVKIEDVRVGNGPEAKAGKKVQVYYEGRLKSNNKVFDSIKQGPGFKFGLGKGDVIKGWDIGVAGMKVGGKRKITCPPHMAYGAKGSPPVIPSNSTLVFEVELKNVN